jgi:hypothetical protein
VDPRFAAWLGRCCVHEVHEDVVYPNWDGVSTTPDQEAPMLKKLALGGIVLLAFAYSLSIATATTPSAKVDPKGTLSPQAPTPQGLCLPPGERC